VRQRPDGFATTSRGKTLAGTDQKIRTTIARAIDFFKTHPKAKEPKKTE
jgi:hypothetical protein